MERDKFLTEAMGELWHRPVHVDSLYVVCACGRHDLLYPCIPSERFSTWQGFGKLWEWSQKQEWWRDLGDSIYEYEDFIPSDICQLEYFIHPDRFANAVYDFLKERVCTNPLK